MPYQIRKLRGKELYSVKNKDTGEVHSQHTSLDNAKKQVKLLYMIHSQKGEGFATDEFNKNRDVNLPVMTEPVLLVPQYFVTQVFPKKLKEGERNFKLVIPTTTSKTLKKKSIKIKRVNNDELELEDEAQMITPPPHLNEFSKADRLKIIEFFKTTESPLNEIEPIKKPKTIRKKKINPEISVPVPENPEIPEEIQVIPESVIREQKKRGRKMKYATVEEAKKAQAEQKREASRKLYKSLTAQRLQQKELRKQQKELKKQQRQQGKGLIKSISKVGNKVVNKISKIGKKVGKFVEKVLNPDEWIPLEVKELMKNKGDEIITSITLRRNPVSSLITGAMNAVSLGSFQKNLDKQPYDKLFHLAMLVTTANTKFLLEKIERVNISFSVSRPEGLEELPVPLNGKQISVFDLINNTILQMGKTKFLDYDAVTNNCQVFIMNVLDANGLLNDENKVWVKQDTEVLFKGNKTLAKISKKLTDIGASANVLIHGGGVLNNYEKNNISQNNIMRDFQYLLPQKELQHKIQLYTMSPNSSSFPEPLEAGMAGQPESLEQIGSGIGRTFKKIGSKFKSGVSKVEHIVNKAEDLQSKVNDAIDRMKGIPDESRAHLKMVGLDLAEILVKRGIPVTASTLAGMLATAVAGPGAGIATSVATGYATQMAMNKLAEEENIQGSSGSGLMGGQIAGGLYAGGQRGSGCGESDSEDECCEMCGQGLLIDKKFSVRDVYNASKSVPKTINKNVKSLKEGKKQDMEGGMIRAPMGSSQSSRPPKTPKVINNGIRMEGGKLGPRPAKGSPEMKEWMAKLRGMKKK